MYQGPHPDTCDFYQKEHNLNNAIQKQINKDKDRLITWCQNQTDATTRTWNGALLYVGIEIAKPFYSPKNNQTLQT